MLHRSNSRILALVTLTLVAGLAACREDTIELERHSAYSHIRIRRQGDVRSLTFVRDSGKEVLESRVDLADPGRLMLAYSRVMFASYLFNPEPERVLIVGLGGGAMVHYLEQHDPDVLVEAVEIDPVVVELADEYFDVRSDGNTTIVTADGVAYLKGAEPPYDVIYMDAFLKPSDATDSAGVPEGMRTLEFYALLVSKLTFDGVVMFNLTPSDGREAEIELIESAFPHLALFDVPGSKNLVAAAFLSDDGDPQERAAKLDDRRNGPFSFAELWRLRRTD